MTPSPLNDSSSRSDRFLIQRCLGKGGMGVVYHAYDQQLRLPVALKKLFATRPSDLYRFKNEFRKLAELEHPNLVSMYELFSEGDQWFYTMEFIEGADFLSTLRPATTNTSAFDTVDMATDRSPAGEVAANSVFTLNIEVLYSLLFQLADALCYIHRQGILHRDIKPSNVLVGKDGRLVLVDFGLLHNICPDLPNEDTHGTTGYDIVGTIAYMSPEQARQQLLSPATDWYSVGVMLYQVLTGRLPLTGTTTQLLIDKLNCDPPPPSHFEPHIPEQLDRLCISLLQRVAQDRPSGDEVYSFLEAQQSRQSPSMDVLPPEETNHFVGRTSHLDQLRNAYGDAVRRNTAVTVLVRGHSGTGKTTLVKHFLDDLIPRDAPVVLRGRCYEQESVPYKAVDSLVDGLSGYLLRLPRHEAEALMPRDIAALAKIFPVLQRVASVAEAPQRVNQIRDQQERRRRAFAALRELLSRIGDRKRLVLLIDDLQWGDVDSANLLNDLVRPPDCPVLLMLLCYRIEDEQANDCISTLLGPSRSGLFLDRRELTVDSLRHEDAVQLAFDLLKQSALDTPEWASCIARESRGNPYVIHELVRYVQDAPWSPNAAPEATLEDVIWARVERLAMEARQLILAVAVAGHPLKLSCAIRAARLSSESVVSLNIAGELRAARLLRNRGAGGHDYLECFHDCIRETIVRRLSPGDLRDLYQSLIPALEKSGDTDAETLAAFCEGAGQLAQAGWYYTLAADQASEALAFERATRLYRQALELSGMEGDERRQLQVRFGNALANAGRGADAAQAYLAAASGAPASMWNDLQNRAAFQYLISGHFDNGIATLRTVVSAVGLKWPKTPRHAIWLLAYYRAQSWLQQLACYRPNQGQRFIPSVDQLDVSWSAALGLTATDIIRASYFQTCNLVLAMKAGDPYRLARALAMQAFHAAVAGAFDKRLDSSVRQADELAQQLDDPHLLGLLNWVRGIFEYSRGYWRAAYFYFEIAEQVFRERCVAVVWELDNAQIFSVYTLLNLGEMAELRRRLPALLEAGAERDDFHLTTMLRSGASAELRLADGNPSGARHETREAMRQWSRQGFHIPHFFSLHAESRIDLYDGDAEAAWKRWERRWPELSQSLLLNIETVCAFALYLRGCTALAVIHKQPSNRALLRVARSDARNLDRKGVLWARPFAEVLRAGIALANGDELASLKHLDAAITGFRDVDMSLFAVAAERQRGLVVGGDEGRLLIDRADQSMYEKSIREPDRYAAALCPGIHCNEGPLHI